MSKRIGIDVGGTFTDFVLLDRITGKLVHHKEPSTPADPARAVELGLQTLLQRASAHAGEVELIVHGTTISLNALLQRRGAKIALVVSTGGRDILELARIRMAHSYDFFAAPDTPLVPRDRVLEIGARLDPHGVVVQAPEPAEYRSIADALKAMDIDAAAILVLNAHRCPSFEKEVAREIGAGVPGLPIVASTEIWPERREYERAMVAVMNAYIEPTMRSYYDRLRTTFLTYGFAAPLSITANNGGTIDIETAYRRPIDTILSGPAAGVVGAADAAARVGISSIVTFDMGGTSADIAIVENGTPELTTNTLIGEIPLMLPVVNISAIGAGGGSILRVDAQGVLKVGPTSAGADPGPACYGKGGRSATITDCYLTCGFLDADGFLGGRLTLSKERANSALGQIAGSLGYLTTDGAARAAEAAIKVASSMMATEVRKLLARRGSDVREFTLLPYGGAGATHAAFLAEEAGIEKILIPKTPGTFCALGAVVAKLKRDFVRSCTIRIAASECADELLATELADLTREATAWSSSIGDRVEKWQLNLSADIRYPGQAFELTIDHEDIRGQTDVGRILRGLFQHKHHKLYGFSDSESPVELVRLVVSAVGALSGVAVSSGAGALNSGERRKSAFLAGNWTGVRCLKRESIMPGDMIDGPAIVEQSDTTVVIPGNWRMTCLDSGDLLLTTRGRAE